MFTFVRYFLCVAQIGDSWRGWHSWKRHIAFKIIAKSVFVFASWRHSQKHSRNVQINCSKNMTRVFWYFWMLRSCFTITLSTHTECNNDQRVRFVCPSFLTISTWFYCVHFFFSSFSCCPQIIALQVAFAYELLQHVSLESDLELQLHTPHKNVSLCSFFSFFSACYAIIFMITEMARHILPQLENKPQMTRDKKGNIRTAQKKNNRWSKERCSR